LRLLGDRGDRKSGGGLGKEVWFRSGTGGGFVGLGFVIFGLVFKIMIKNSASRGAWLVLRRLLLRSNFFCSEKPTARPSGAAHGMLMAGFVEIWLKGEHEKQREREEETGKKGTQTLR